MNHNFTHDELNLLCVNRADNRNDAISNLDAYIQDIEDRAMCFLCYSTMLKLKDMTDEEYLQLLDTLIPDFDPTEA